MGGCGLGQSRDRSGQPTVTGVTYDTGVLIGAERNRENIWKMHNRTLARGMTPTVPAGVLAQAWDGGPQPLLSRFLKGCRIEAPDERLARLVGAASRRYGVTDVVDVSVVMGADRRGDEVVTGDRRDVVRLAGSLGVPVHLV